MLKSGGNTSHRVSVRIFTFTSLVIGGCVIILYFIFNSANLNTSFIPLHILFKTDAHQKAAFVNSNDRLESSLSPQLQWCTSNPFLSHYNQSAILDLELRWFAWNRNKLPTTYNILKEYALSPGSKKRNIVHMAYPDSLPLPCPYHGGLKRYGDSGDGGKILCGVGDLAPLPECIVYSLGSGGQFNFEIDLLNRTSCKVHT